MDTTSRLQFVYLPTFERTAGHLSDEVLRRVEQELIAAPRRGDTMKGTGGFRKIRVALGGRGKSGGARRRGDQERPPSVGAIAIGTCFMIDWTEKPIARRV